MKEFRLLYAHEIECRVNTVVSNNKGTSCSLLLYKDARVDMKLLDEKCGVMDWKRSHEVIDGNLYCTISIWDSDKKEWVSKQDVGTESFTEKEKGQASDSFKRAGFNWGIGRELYTAPSIWVRLNTDEISNKNGKPTTYARFVVSEIGYDEDKCINKLVITDMKGVVRYSFNKDSEEVMQPVIANNGDGNPLMDVALSDFKNAGSMESLEMTWKNYESLHGNKAFRRVYMEYRKNMFESSLKGARTIKELRDLWEKNSYETKLPGMKELKDKRKGELSRGTA